MIALALVALAAPLARPEDPAPPPSRSVQGIEGPVGAFCASPDGEVLVVGTEGALVAWSVDDGETLWRSELPKVPAQLFVAVGEELVAFAQGMAAVDFRGLGDGVQPEGQRGIGGTTAMLTCRGLALDPQDRWVWLGTHTGIVTRLTPGNVQGWSNRSLDNGGVTCLALDARGKTLFVGGEDGTVRQVGGKSANVDDKRVFEGHAKPVTALAVDPRGAWAVSDSEAGDLRLWKASSCKERALVREGSAVVRVLAVDAKGDRFACGLDDGTVEVRDFDDGELVVALPARGKDAPVGLAFVEKNDTLVVAGDELELWDLSDL